MGTDEPAPAKVNLTLHVTGRRADGYHLLDSLVAFVEVGDRISLTPAETLTMEVTGPEATHVPAGDDNLVLRAAGLAGFVGRIALEKRLPVASGLGGGSADAAAVLRAVARMGRTSPPEAVLSLGADVPVCLAGRPARMRGIGERLSGVPPLPAAGVLLVNPRVQVATAAVFAGLGRRSNAPMPEVLPPWRDVAALASWLARQRNDLEAPARDVAPAIATVLAALRATDGCRLARMTGSGATCFGLYATRAEAEIAATRMDRGWWVAATQLARATT